MESPIVTVDLKGAVSRWRTAVYVIAFAGMLAVFVIHPEGRSLTTLAVLAAGLILSIGRDRESIYYLLLWDLVVSIVVWWLYGPISGAALIALAVVAVGPLLLDRRQTRLLLLAALFTVPIETTAHFVASAGGLPLFHPPDPVPTSEFLIGQVIQFAALVGVGILMIGVSQMLRRGQLALAADLERQRELNTLKDRFVATVSHELRTPLTSLKGFTRMLLEGDVDQGESSEFLGIMVDQAEELHARIEDLITFSRLGADAITIKTVPVEVHDLTSQVLSDLGSRAADVDNRVPPGLKALADPPRLRQVMRILLDNALKYGKAPIVVIAGEEGPEVRCAVLDSGAGIPPEEVDLVFEPYARLVDDTTMSSPGLGLGLPIVKGLIGAHGGQVRIVDDEDMNGVAFTLPSVQHAPAHGHQAPRSELPTIAFGARQ